MKKRLHPKYTSSTAAAERTPTNWLYILLTIACAAFLAAGFFFAARQHFAAMDLGMKNSKLRQQIDEMESQKRQLTLAREIVRSPAEVKRIAINKGFRERQTDVVTIGGDVAASNPLVERTSLVTRTSTERKPVKAFFPMAGTGKKAASEKSKTEKKSSIDPRLLAVNNVR